MLSKFQSKQKLEHSHLEEFIERIWKRHLFLRFKAILNTPIIILLHDFFQLK